MRRRHQVIADGETYRNWAPGCIHEHHLRPKRILIWQRVRLYPVGGIGSLRLLVRTLGHGDGCVRTGWGGRGHGKASVAARELGRNPASGHMKQPPTCRCHKAPVLLCQHSHDVPPAEVLRPSAQRSKGQRG
eukprot:scaffold1307_cov200-Pinguiococcus_pyrenoidosus.AAC.14